ncbi:hypothetical protein AB0M45_31705 [Nocardia sp. NPDC051787]|uniref:hypothetical protein n=1 Tax=Nocardia sp. NPDC051787 TaxID=3155415 RepID=UPI0034304448
MRPAPLRIEFGDGNRLDLILRTVDRLRQTPQRPGITSQLRYFDLSSELLEDLDAQPAAVRTSFSKTKPSPPRDCARQPLSTP